MNRKEVFESIRKRAKKLWELFPTDWYDDGRVIEPGDLLNGLISINQEWELCATNHDL